MDLGLRLRAVQLGKPHLVASHRSAAALHGIELLNEGERAREGHQKLEFIDVTKKGRPTGLRLHHMSLHAGDVLRGGGGLLHTSAARTVADLLRQGPRDEALVATESALTPRTLPWGPRPALVELREVDYALAAPGIRGSRRALKWLNLANLAAQSPAETVARLRIHEADLHPETGVVLHVPGGRRRYPDFFFRSAGLVVEIEGYRWHGSRQAHRADMARFNELIRCPGVRYVLRYGAAHVFWRPQEMIAEIRRTLAASPSA